MSALWKDRVYRECASEVIPTDVDVVFHQVRNDGRHYSENLDLIKEDLRSAVRDTGADTILLSLGSGAKILCVELARECGLRAIDFGSMMRGLAYAASPGALAHRAMHHPFFFFVPFDSHMRAVEKAFPALTLKELGGKAYAQLALELHPHERLCFNSTDGVDGGRLELSRRNLVRFRASWRLYRRQFWPLWRRDASVAELDRDFRYWLRKHGVGVQGVIFLKLVAMKRWLRRLRLVR